MYNQTLIIDLKLCHALFLIMKLKVTFITIGCILSRTVTFITVNYCLLDTIHYFSIHALFMPLPSGTDKAKLAEST